MPFQWVSLNIFGNFEIRGFITDDVVIKTRLPGKVWLHVLGLFGHAYFITANDGGQVF